eukprot:GHUV01006660.1.p1 GENE.GHUV01006660.1~~GHUV01006660.1.p1  ORF type:complete len:262 (+),score=62.04 GHUV01006660.1:98-883(+)
MRAFGCFLCFALLAAAIPATLAQNNVLVLIGSSSVKDTHSQFFDDLRAASFNVDIKSVKDKSLKLKEYDTFLYDSLVLFAPKASNFGGDVSNQAILDFVDSGKNLLLAASPDASDNIRSLALECGVELDDKGATVYDHFSHQAADGADDPTLVATTAVVESSAIFGSNQPKAPVLFQGAAATVPSSSELAIVALSGEPTAYSADPSKASPDPPALPVGGGAALVTLVQVGKTFEIVFIPSAALFVHESEADLAPSLRDGPQ